MPEAVANNDCIISCWISTEYLIAYSYYLVYKAAQLYELIMCLPVENDRLAHISLNNYKIQMYQ
jgi:hypothetical protein